jgi:hypothetical protein
MAHADKLRGLLARARVDFAPKHAPPRGPQSSSPSSSRSPDSLAADATLVAIGIRVFPSTKGFVHFHFSDYGKLTVIGVIVACAGWPIVRLLSLAPRWLFVRLAILVLIVMHLAIALVTYNTLVHLAPVGRRQARVAR